VDHSTKSPGDPIARTLEREAGLIQDAIAMVASGHSRRVVVGGIRFGDQLMESAQRMASEAGVRLVPLWTTDEAGVDIAIERIDHD
jgi:diphthamide synthase (EF-2-diphthine--ammonia ligase)